MLGPTVEIHGDRVASPERREDGAGVDVADGELLKMTEVDCARLGGGFKANRYHTANGQRL